MREREFWLDHVLDRANLYSVSGNGGVKSIVPFGTVIQQGTNQDADHFNSIEEGLTAIELAALILITRYGHDKDALDAKIQELVNTLDGFSESITEQGNEINKIKSVETGTKSLTNSLTFPFNNSKATVSLATARNNGNYIVIPEVVSAVGSVGEIIITDQLTNGFKIEYTGSAKSATISYKVIGGWS